MKNSIQVISAILSAFLVVGPSCSAKLAQAPRVDVSATDGDLVVRNFPRADIEFKDSQLFLWKKEATPSDVSQVLQSSTRYEGLKVELFTKRKRRKVMYKDFEELFKSVKFDDSVSLDEKISIGDLPEKESGLAAKTEELKALNADLETLEKQPPAEADTSRIARLKNKIAVKEGQLRPVQLALVAIKDAGLDAEYQEWKELELELARLDLDASATLASINQNVQLFNSSPIKFGFTFGRGRTIHATLSNWKLNDIQDPEVAEQGVSPDFSTDLFTMGKVHYKELGGVFDFEVYTPQAVYWFKIARNNYGAKDARIHYKGDIVRCSVTGGAGRPMVLHDGTKATCGVNSEDLDAGSEEIGKPEIRRGAANLTDLDDKS